MVIDKVLSEGKEYSGDAIVLGKSALGDYIPIKDKNGNIIGMWSEAIYIDELNKEISSTMFMVIILALILLAAGIVISYIIGNKIAKGIAKIKEKMGMIKRGEREEGKEERREGWREVKEEIGQRGFEKRRPKIPTASTKKDIKKE